MQATYLITQPPTDSIMQTVIGQLQRDIQQDVAIGQLFFYADAVSIGTLTEYSAAITNLIELADAHDMILSICSAGFQKRQYQLSPLAEQDFTFKGLGQFIAESRHADIARLIPSLAANSLAANLSSSAPTYSLLVSLTQADTAMNLKEYLDIALVSASYEVTTAIFIDNALMRLLQRQTDAAIELAFNMIADFDIPLFSDKKTTLYECTATAANLADLHDNSQHHYPF